MGGMLVMGIGYIVYGFIAPRFVAAPRPQRSKRHEHAMNTHGHCADRAALLAALRSWPLALPAAAAGTLDKVKRDRQADAGLPRRHAAVRLHAMAASRPASRWRCARRWPTR